MKAKRVVLMDFDGTVVASDGIWSDVYIEYCAFKRMQPLETVTRLQGCVPFDDWILSIKEGHKITNSSQTVLSDMYDVATGLYCKKRPNDGFADFLEVHKEDEIMIVSNEETRLIDSYLKHWGVDLVSSIFQDKDNGRLNTAFYKRCAYSAGCDVAEMIYIDDSLSHCVAAKASGAFVVGFNDGHTENRQMQMKSICDKYINSFNELCVL